MQLRIRKVKIRKLLDRSPGARTAVFIFCPVLNFALFSILDGLVKTFDKLQFSTAVMPSNGPSHDTKIIFI